MSEKMVACNLTLDEIKGLAKTVKENDLERIKIKNGDCEVIIEAKGKKCPPPMPMMPTMAGVQPMMTVQNVNTSSSPQNDNVSESKPEVNGNTVKSPIVGTFYSSPAPDKPPFVKIGDKVKKGDVIMIIESMKLMNEVQSDFDGEVLDILVENGQAVEYDQPIMIIG